MNSIMNQNIGANIGLGAGPKRKDDVANQANVAQTA